MKIHLMLALTAAALLTLGGCSSAESPAKVNNDVAKAADTAAANDQKAAEQQAQTNAAAAQDEAKAENKADSKMAAASADAAVTQAEGDNKIALAKCEALQGDAQRACKDQANAALEMAKARAKAMKADHS